jgi:hypothetical protein
MNPNAIRVLYFFAFEFATDLHDTNGIRIHTTR